MDETYENSEKFVPAITLDFSSWLSLGTFCLIFPISFYIVHKIILETDKYDLIPINNDDILSKKIFNLLFNIFQLIMYSLISSGVTFGCIYVLFRFEMDLLTNGILFMTPIFILVWLKSYSIKKKMRENDR